MRRSCLFACCLALSLPGFAQETQVPKTPFQTKGAVSAYRYEPIVSVECDGAAIPPSDSARLICDLVESPQRSQYLGTFVEQALALSPGISKEDVSVTWLELCRENNGPPAFGHFQGNEMLFASGVVRPFYATALAYQCAINNVSLKPYAKDLDAMLAHGNNAATNRLVDAITNTSSDGHLSKGALTKFATKRNVVNAFYVNCLGLENFNANQKIWVGEPSASDSQLLGEKLELNYENSNRMTTNQAAALFYLINAEGIGTKNACKMMKSVMSRALEQAKVGPLAGICGGLPVGSRFFGINGYTVRNYNDVGVVVLPNHKTYVLAVFTKYREYPSNFIALLSELIATDQMTETGDNEPATTFGGRPNVGF
ncbi:MAG: serine hydrolase [Candidatus Sumerlaeaceae bacterium]|nr:serine hydrolase [Candidatus Sumerlaeaceae bacterium]